MTELPPPPPYRNLWVPLVVVPALIVMVLVLVFVFFSSIVGEEASPRENLARMLEGGANERRQASFNLVRQTLDELGIAERTILIFLSDNGGRIPTTSNAPLRAGKGSCYEGGVRVPLIVYWPNATPPGSECAEPVISMDLYPTVLEMVGLSTKDGSHLDGVSLVPLLRQNGPFPERSLFWHYPHYGNQGGDPWTVNVADGDQRTMSIAEIATEYRNGVVNDETYCWKDGMADWLPLREIEQIYNAVKGGRAQDEVLVSPQSVPPGPQPAAAGRTPTASC